MHLSDLSCLRLLHIAVTCRRGPSHLTPLALLAWPGLAQRVVFLFVERSALLLSFFSVLEVEGCAPPPPLFIMILLYRFLPFLPLQMVPGTAPRGVLQRSSRCVQQTWYWLERLLSQFNLSPSCLFGSLSLAPSSSSSSSSSSSAGHGGFGGDRKTPRAEARPRSLSRTLGPPEGEPPRGRATSTAPLVFCFSLSLSLLLLLLLLLHALSLSLSLSLLLGSLKMTRQLTVRIKLVMARCRAHARQPGIR